MNKKKRKNRRNKLGYVGVGQTAITGVDNCIECMRVCPVGHAWENIRPRTVLSQRSSGTEPTS
jgi:hypothetical protein